MSLLLSESNIEVLENFILSQSPENSDYLPSISECYRDDAIKYWKTINDPNTPVTSYFQFASSSYGFTSYAFYKTRDGRIFLITSYCSELSCYFNVTNNWHILIPYNDFVQKQSDILLISNETSTNSDVSECKCITL
jgi:hypothetical protein